MTEQTNSELIAEARDVLEQHDLGDVCDESTHAALTTVLDALEAAERDLNQLAAVIEKAEDFVTRHYLDMRFGDEVLPMLATAPQDVLRERDAALIEGLAENFGENQMIREGDVKEWLHLKARQRREEQS